MPCAHSKTAGHYWRFSDTRQHDSNDLHGRVPLAALACVYWSGRSTTRLVVQKGHGNQKFNPKCSSFGQNQEDLVTDWKSEVNTRRPWGTKSWNHYWWRIILDAGILWPFHKYPSLKLQVAFLPYISVAVLPQNTLCNTVNFSKLISHQMKRSTLGVPFHGQLACLWCGAFGRACHGRAWVSSLKTIKNFCSVYKID